MTGIRQTSLLDNRRRPSGNFGRSLRWYDLQIAFAGYADDDQPEFSITGTASGTKHAQNHGNEQFYDFLIGKRKATDRLSSAKDVALGVVALAVFQGVMDPALQQLVYDKSFGLQLTESITNRCSASIAYLSTNMTPFSSALPEIETTDPDIIWISHMLTISIDQ
jgi:hypothetical protein